MHELGLIIDVVEKVESVVLERKVTLKAVVLPPRCNASPVGSTLTRLRPMRSAPNARVTIMQCCMARNF